MHDELCHGHHVWKTEGATSVCERCGFIDIDPDAAAWPYPISVAALIDFAAAHPKYRRNHDEEIRQGFRITPSRYFQLLHRAIRTEEALRHDPHTTRRIRRQLGL